MVYTMEINASIIIIFKKRNKNAMILVRKVNSLVIQAKL